MSIFDKFRSVKLSIGRGYRILKGKIYSGITAVSGFNSFVPERLTIEPHDLRTADPLIAQEFYSGHYTLGGLTIDSQGVTPFSILSKNELWEKELHSFEWLRHFSANQDTLSDSHARALVRDWIELNPEQASKFTWEIETTSKRLISFLSHSIVLLNNADPEFHYIFMRSLGKHVKVLRRLLVDSPNGMPMLFANFALTYASICFNGNTTSLVSQRNKLDQILREQILADGGHLSRNPALIPEILAKLLPLKQGFIAIDVAPPTELLNAIERLLPALRFFRHGDGSIARFNGAGVSETGLITSLIRYDENMGTPIKDALHSGYQRAVLNDAFLIMDTALPPKGELSNDSNAGILSFEFSSGLSTLIVNCGVPANYDKQTSQVWRTTNAHSTATINNTSMTRFENPGSENTPLSGQVFYNKIRVDYAREDTNQSTTITAAHDGYVREFGIRHQRSLTLDNNGDRLYGQEWFSGLNKSDMRYTTKDNVALRFHLHPDVKASLSANQETCLLETRDGAQWRFDCPGFKLELTESIFFSTLPKPKPTWQILIQTKAYDNPEINWALQKIPAT